MQDPNNTPGSAIPKSPDEQPEDDTEEIQYMHQSPNGFKTPYYQWTGNLVNETRPTDYIDVPEHLYRNMKVANGQPFRRALADEEETGLPLPRTYGTLMLPDSFDPVANPELEPDSPPGIPMHAHPPDAKAHEVLAGMAQDMVEVGSVMVARMRVAIGYEPDAKMIRLYKELAVALSKMYYVTREHDQSKQKAKSANQPKRPPGRPRKSSQPT